jgi:hypothetical protein
MDESTARFGFLGASGMTSLCSVGAFSLAVNEQPGAAILFVVLALISIAAMLWFGRIYRRLRSVRWTEELRASQAALDALLQAPPPRDESQADGGAEPPREPHERT